MTSVNKIYTIKENSLLTIPSYLTKEPLYRLIIDTMIDNIETKKWMPDSKIPAERALSIKYNVSRATIRTAIAELKKKGLVYQKKGSGTYISKHNQNHLVQFYSFTEQMKKIGKIPSSIVIAFELIIPPKYIVKKLELEADDQVYYIERLRLADDAPMMIEATYIPQSRMKNLTLERVKQSPLYDIFREDYHVIIMYAIESFRSTIVPNEYRSMLECRKNESGMLITRLTHTQKGPIEYTESIARGDSFSYEVTLFPTVQIIPPVN